MALSAWQATIVNESGDVIPSASIEVINEATGLTATIYANAGGGSLGNPFSAGTNGFARFYADAGSYTITASDAGSGFSESFNNVRLGNAQGYDVGSGAGEIPRNSDLPTFGTAAAADIGAGAGEIPRNSDLPTFGTAAEANIGTAPSEVPTNSDLGTASTKDTGTATGQVPTADELGVVGETNWHSGNYTPSSSIGLNARQLLINNTGGIVSNGATTSGANLLYTRITSTGSLAIGSSVSVGTWKYVGGINIANRDAGIYVRTV